MNLSIILFLFVVATFLALPLGAAAEAQVGTPSTRPTPPPTKPPVTKTELLLAYAAYCPLPILKDWSCYWCTYKDSASSLTNVATVANGKTETQGYVGLDAKSNRIVVGFRGTELLSLKNWGTDLSANPRYPYKDHPGVAIHDGFYSAWTSVKDDLLAKLQDVQKLCPTKNCTIAVVGHSLGGALATVAAVELMRWNVSSKIELYSFGAPRVGVYDFSKYVSSLKFKSVRMVNKGDIFPHVPPRLGQLTYYHVAMEYWWDGKKYHICDKADGEDQSCSASIGYLDTSIPDHKTYYDIDLYDGLLYKCGAARLSWNDAPASQLFVKPISIGLALMACLTLSKFFC